MRFHFLSAFLLLCLCGVLPAQQPDKTDVLALDKITTLFDVIQLVKQHHVGAENITHQQLLEGAIQGVLSCLDPYSQYLSPTEYKLLLEDNEGEFGGVGMTVQERQGKLHIVAILPGGPASKTDLQTGDIILAANGREVDDEDLLTCMGRLRGRPGTTVEVRVFRPGDNQEHLVKIKREIIELQSVTAPQLLEGNRIFYAKIDSFIQTTAQTLGKALKTTLRPETEAIILDLRDNPGGLLESAMDICSMFLPPRTLVVTTRGNSLAEKKHLAFVPQKNYTARPAFRVPDHIRLAILINEMSASASEIVAACLSDYKRALLVGTRSYGKGSVQNIIELEDGSAIKLTIALYYTPNDKRPVIEKNGVAPDISIPMPEEQFLKALDALKQNQTPDLALDTQLAKAIEVLQTPPGHSK